MGAGGGWVGGRGAHLDGGHGALGRGEADEGTRLATSAAASHHKDFLHLAVFHKYLGEANGGAGREGAGRSLTHQASARAPAWGARSRGRGGRLGQEVREGQGRGFARRGEKYVLHAPRAGGDDPAWEGVCSQLLPPPRATRARRGPRRGEMRHGPDMFCAYRLERVLVCAGRSPSDEKFVLRVRGR